MGQTTQPARRLVPHTEFHVPWSSPRSQRQRHSDPNEFERLLNCLTEGNIRWAKFAPILMLSIATLNFERNGKPDRHAFHDVGLAIGNLVIQATHLEPHVHQIAGIVIDRIREKYKIPGTHEPVAGIAIGYYGEMDQLADDLKQRELSERTRKPLEQFVFSGSWNKPHDLVTK